MKLFFNRFLFLTIVFITASAFAVLSLKPVDANDAVTFVIKNLGLNIKGELSGLRGSVEWNEENPESSKFTVTVAASSINTGIDMRDNHLKKEDYFDVEKYPDIKLVSQTITKANDGYIMNGALTIKNVTRNISFPFSATKKTDVYLFSGKFTINRRDFGVGGSSVTIGDNVDVSLNVTAK
jgi:polyisoprenoid-binding protein YceI